MFRPIVALTEYWSNSTTRGGGEYFWKFLVRVYRPVLQILGPDFRLKNAIFHTRPPKSILVSDLSFRLSEIMLYDYLD